MDIQELRGKIDAIDDQLVKLFAQRMAVAAQIADYKKGRGLPVLDARREQEKLDAVLRAAQLAPSACNGQPYHFTVCRGEKAKLVAKATQGMGMNKFATDAPVMLVLSEMPYVATAALGAKVKKNDYRSIDIGIAAACGHAVAPAARQTIKAAGQQFCAESTNRQAKRRFCRAACRHLFMFNHLFAPPCV